MASYDRRILLPYLQDVCSVELLCSRLTNQINLCECEIQNLRNAINQRIVDPACPSKSDYHNESSGLASLVVFVPITLGGLLICTSFGWNIIGIGIMLFGLLGVWIGISDYNEEARRVQNQYSNAWKKYEECVEKNKKIREKIPQYKSALSGFQRHLTILKNRLDDAEEIRTKIYGVNVIPGKYRNKYVAYYLYDYFNTSRENDLDKIIQTLLLDEIKQRLDKIIVQNEEILLNQRVQIALQERQNRAIAENHREELQNIARLERNQELQIDYQNMIAKNQELTNFFLAADYLQKNK